MTEPGPQTHTARLASAKALWDALPLHQHLGITLEAIGDGFARYRLTASEANRGGVHGSVHGGILALVIDVASLAATSTVIGSNERAAGTAELNISYLRPALGPRVITEARVLRKGQVLAVTDVEISDGDGKLLAKGRVGYAVRPVSEPARRGEASRRESGGTA